MGKKIEHYFEKLFFKIKGKKIKKFSKIKKYFENKKGLEIGGPSKIFNDKGYIPIYNCITELDGCNFSNITIWEGTINEGMSYNYYKQRTGIQYLTEATDLSMIQNSKYDFVISSNCLEHIANPLKALGEWIRVLKKDGVILLILPKKEKCFDHKRSVTLFSHILEDYKNNIREDDLTHLEEILKLHDLEMDKPAGNIDQFRMRSMKNYENRALHHHIFNSSLLIEIFNYFKINIIDTIERDEYVIIGKKI